MSEKSSKSNAQISNVSYLEVDYHNPQHTGDLLEMLQMYASDPMGAGKPLGTDITDTLIAKMAARPHVFSVLAYGDVQGAERKTQPIAFANCIESFSTFKAKPVVNIHDFAIIEQARGHGISQGLMNCIEGVSKQRGACKITLEVLQGNIAAQKAYVKSGFKGYELDPNMGQAMFWEKPLTF
jgi:ribosomal protein S18 acetylase RimI-like enzyme